MTRFADDLYDDLMRDHGRALAGTRPPVARRSLASHRVALTAGVGGLAAAATAGSVIALSGSPAYALTSNHDGTQTLAVYQEAGIAQANAKFQQLKEPVVVVPVKAGCPSISSLPKPVPTADHHAIAIAVGVVLVLRADDDDDVEVRLKADAASFLAVAATSFGVILLAELGDLSDIVIANLSAKYHHPIAVGIGSVLALWSVVVLAIVGGKRLQRILPLRWIARLAALAMVIMAGFTLAEALR